MFEYIYSNQQFKNKDATPEITFWIDPIENSDSIENFFSAYLCLSALKSISPLLLCLLLCLLQQPTFPHQNSKLSHWVCTVGTSSCMTSQKWQHVLHSFQFIGASGKLKICSNIVNNWFMLLNIVLTNLCSLSWAPLFSCKILMPKLVTIFWSLYQLPSSFHMGAHAPKYFKL